jgi:hypothetical protein
MLLGIKVRNVLNFLSVRGVKRAGPMVKEARKQLIGKEVYETYKHRYGHHRSIYYGETPFLIEMTTHVEIVQKRLAAIYRRII